MNKRFWIICSVMVIALMTLSILGLSSLGMHEKGLRADRQQEFITVAKQVSSDVKKKVDAFLYAEQSRPYTDYQYYYVPVTSNGTAALVRSPLGDKISNSFAYGYFQLDDGGDILTPYAANEYQATGPVLDNYANIKENLLPSLSTGESMEIRRINPIVASNEEYSLSSGKSIGDLLSLRTYEPKTRDKIAETIQKTDAEPERPNKQQNKKSQAAPSNPNYGANRAVYDFNFDNNGNEIKVMEQSRSNVDYNNSINDAIISNNTAQQNTAVYSNNQEQLGDTNLNTAERTIQTNTQQGQITAERQNQQPNTPQTNTIRQQEDTQVFIDEINRRQQLTQSANNGIDDLVQVRIEPFVPLTVAGTDNKDSIFDGQVFLLRHVQIEDNHFMQGFQLDESKLVEQITDSAQQFIRRGMGFEVSKQERLNAAYTAILDFGFGDVVLNFIEEQPGWILARVAYIRNWFFGILGVVWLAVIISLGAFWRNMREQVLLSRKKDDFISAVSHELRTPLTSIRMYTEMLEKGWVKTDDKRNEYYATMRQESERLTRLIENVLDFSRIQRDKKRFNFTVGDVNQCIADVVKMIQPCAERIGFEVKLELGAIESFTFDRDAVTQIVINLLDNAFKYARNTEDKHIVIRTKMQKGYAVIEVQDHGPGIARNQQKKIFEAFYRCGDESTRETTGTGLGLTLVKRFAEAHHGFVEIINSKPNGALFRVGLANQIQA